MMCAKKMPPEIGVGMPAALKLNAFGVWVFHAFGDCPYLVGSAVRGKSWRDVDVRLILPDEEYDALFGPRQGAMQTNAKWSLFCAAFSALAKEQTGLPVDFQFDRRTEANQQHEGTRQPLGIWVKGREP